MVFWLPLVDDDARFRQLAPPAPAGDGLRTAHGVARGLPARNEPFGSAVVELASR